MSDPTPDGNRTVFRPSPLQALKATGANGPSPPISKGNAAPLPAPSRSPDRDAAVSATPRAGQVGRDTSPPTTMIVAAAPVLALAAGMRVGRVRLPLEQFHRQAAAAILAAGEALGRAYPADGARRAVFALCAMVDDIALHLPGHDAEGADWARRSITQAYFQTSDGERFWQIVDEALRDPSANRDLIALYQACIAAGIEGRFREMPEGREHLHALGTTLCDALGTAMPLPPSDLSPQWRGEQAPVPRTGVPRFAVVAAALVAVSLLAAYIALRLLLAGSGAAPAAAIAAINPDGPLRLSRGSASKMPTPLLPPASRRQAMLSADTKQVAAAKRPIDTKTTAAGTARNEPIATVAARPS